MRAQSIVRSNWKVLGLSALLAGIAVAAACGTDDGEGPAAPGGGNPSATPTVTPTPSPVPGGKQELAPIEDVSLSESSTEPGKWILHVQYGLPNGCYSPAGYSIRESFPPQVDVYVSTYAGPNTACTMIYGIATLDIDLGGGLEACKYYDILVNQKSYNLLAISPVAICPVDGGQPPLPQGFGAETAPIEGVGLVGTLPTPASWTLQVTYGLKNGCALPGNYSMTKSIPPQYMVNAYVPIDPNTVCTEIYGTASLEIPLGVGMYEACKVYVFTVNGKEYRAQAITPVVRCANPDGLPVSTPVIDESTGLISGYDQLFYSLQGYGLKIERAEPFKEGFFGFAPSVLLVDGQSVQVNEFQSVRDAETAAGFVSADGTGYAAPGEPVVSVQWIATPHFYRLGNTIAIYPGDDVDILLALEYVSGGQFAGGEYALAPYSAAFLGSALELAGYHLAYLDMIASVLSGAVTTELFGTSAGTVQAYEYSSADEARKQQERISLDGTVIGKPDGSIESIVWESDVHFFRRSNLIAIYVGTDTKMLTSLQANLGPQFAGVASNGVLQPVPSPLPFPTPTTGPSVVVEAPIESFDISVSKSLPPQYAVRVVYGLPGGCTKPGGTNTVQKGTVIEITVTNVRPARDLMCTMVYGTAEVTIDLGTGFVKGAEYTVRVNGKEKKFVAS